MVPIPKRLLPSRAAAREQENLASRIERQEALTELVAACADVELPGDDEDETAPGEVE